MGGVVFLEILELRLQKLRWGGVLEFWREALNGRGCRSYGK